MDDLPDVSAQCPNTAEDLLFTWEVIGGPGVWVPPELDVHHAVDWVDGETYWWPTRLDRFALVHPKVLAVYRGLERLVRAALLGTLFVICVASVCFAFGLAMHRIHAGGSPDLDGQIVFYTGIALISGLSLFFWLYRDPEESLPLSTPDPELPGPSED